MQVRQVGVVLLLVLGATREVRAQDAETNLQIQEADAMVAQGRQAEAGPLYEQLFSTTKQSDYLFKGAVAFSKAGNNAKALALFQQYLAVDAGGVHSKAAYDWIARLSPDVAEPERQREDAAVKQRAAAAAKAREARAAAEQTWMADHPEYSQRFYARQRSRRRLGLIVGAGGVVVMGIGIAFAVAASGESDNVSSTTKWNQSWQDEADAGARNSTIANVCIFGGAAVVITGIVLYARGRGGTPTAPAEAISVAPVVAPGGAGLELAGAF
jgi:hypothetical protein